MGPGRATPEPHDDVEQPRRDLLERAHSPHPLGRAQLAFLDRDWARLDDAFAAWEPEARGDGSIKAVLSAQSAQAQGTSTSPSPSSKTAVPGARGRRTQPPPRGTPPCSGLPGVHRQPKADFTRAQALAVQARDSRRRWSGDSVAPTLVAIKASAFASDLNRTWQFTQVEPDGNANPSRPPTLA